MKKIIFLSTIFFTASLFTSLWAQKDFQILKTFHIQSGGGWDYIAVGPGNNRLYVSHGTQVNILDKTTGDSIGVIENTTGVHGITFDKSQNKGFTSNGRLNNVTVFDLTTNTVITQIPTGANPDAIMYEPYTKKIITCNALFVLAVALFNIFLQFFHGTVQVDQNVRLHDLRVNNVK